MPYHDLAIPVQVVRDLPLLTLFLDGDAQALKRMVPPPLRPHADHRIVLNTWVADDQALGTAFGPDERVGVLYLAAEVEGREGQTVDGRARYPGRFWLRHWCNSPTVRDYALRASGLILEPAAITLERVGEKLTFRMHADDGCTIEACATINGKKRGTAASRSVYYASRRNGDSEEVAQFDIPAVADAFDLELVEASCRNIGGAGGLPEGAQCILASSFRRMTIVPYIAFAGSPTAGG